MAGKPSIGELLKELTKNGTLRDGSRKRVQQHINSGGPINEPFVSHLEQAGFNLDNINVRTKNQSASASGQSTNNSGGGETMKPGARKVNLNRQRMGSKKPGPVDQQAVYGKYYDGKEKVTDRVGAVGKRGADQFKRSFGPDADGWDMAKGVGGHALRGAVGGAAIGGTLEAVQGGSFWTGAKEGAFTGAVGWAGYRSAKRAFSDKAYNPDGGWGSTVRGLGTSWAKTGQAVTKEGKATNSVNVSKQVRALSLLEQGLEINKAGNKLS